MDREKKKSSYKIRSGQGRKLVPLPKKMPKEFLNLSVGEIARNTQNLEDWLPHPNDPDIKKPITVMRIGLTYSDSYGFAPVEIDLLKSQPKTIFIVGGEKSLQDYFLMSLIKISVKSISEAGLEVNTIVPFGDPRGIIADGEIARYTPRPYQTQVPQSEVAAKTLARIADKATTPVKFNPKKEDPHLFVIDDLANLIRSIGNQRGEMANLSKILNYSGKRAILTVATLNYSDADFLKAANITKGRTNAIWLFGKSDEPGSRLEKLVPGSFVEWDKKRKRFSENPIYPFII